MHTSGTMIGANPGSPVVMDGVVTSGWHAGAASACGKLDAFVNEVQGLPANKIPAAAAADLITAAQRIRTTLGCP